MIAVEIPTTDVNTDSVEVIQWWVEDRAEVRAGEPLVEVETSKSIIDIAAPSDGVVLRLCADGDRVPIDRPLGYVFASIELLESYESERANATVPAADAHAGRITAPARRRADELGLDIEAIARTTDQLVTSKLVEAFVAQNGNGRPTNLPEPREARPGAARLVIIGGGLGATQVLDILVHDDQQQAVAIVDDDHHRWGELIEDVPVVGDTARALELFAAAAFDAAVIAVGTSVTARARLRQRCEAAGLPLANVIDPTARIATGVRMGSGNLICAHCHFGAGTVVGDNNFFSAYNSFDHHSEIGSDNATGPNCMTSGLVKIGDRCRFGMGISIEPYVTIGDGVQVASGAVIVSSVPADHAVKTKVVTTAVVPVRRN